MELIVKLSGLLKAIAYTIHVKVRAVLKLVVLNQVKVENEFITRAGSCGFRRDNRMLIRSRDIIVKVYLN